MTTGEAARVLRVSPEGVRQFVQRGTLACERTRSGQRLLREEDVRDLAHLRVDAALVTTRPAVIKRPRGAPCQQNLFGAQLRMAKVPFARRDRLRILNRKAG